MVPLLREQELSPGFRRLATQRSLAAPTAPLRLGSFARRPNPPTSGPAMASSRAAFRARAATLAEAGLASPRGMQSVDVGCAPVPLPGRAPAEARMAFDAAQPDQGPAAGPHLSRATATGTLTTSVQRTQRARYEHGRVAAGGSSAVCFPMSPSGGGSQGASSGGPGIDTESEADKGSLPITVGKASLHPLARHVVVFVTANSISSAAVDAAIRTVK